MCIRDRLQADSISNMLNRADYVNQMYDYDRQKLEEYKAITEEVKRLGEQLQDEKEELEQMQQDYQNQQAELQGMLDKKKATAGNYEAQLSDAKAKAKEYQSLIQQQNDQLKKIEEERKRQEAAAAAAAQQNNNAGQGTGGGSGSGGSSGSGGGSKPSASGSGMGSQIANFALQFVGRPYVLGGTSLTNGADCSGFIWAVYNNFGISVPRTSGAQGSGGRAVSFDDIQAGDVLYYGGHVGIYIGGGQIVHASTPSSGIKISSATYKTIISVRRYV